MNSEQITVTNTGDVSLDVMVEVSITGEILAKMLAIELEEFNLMPLEYIIMFQIMMRGGSMRPTDMSLDLFRAKSLISAAISELETKGFVKRLVNKSDLRSFKISLTKKGTSTIKKIIDTRRELAHNSLSIFSPEKIERLKDDMVAFRKHIVNIQIRGESLRDIQKA